MKKCLCMKCNPGVNEEDVGKQFKQQEKHSSDEPPDRHACSVSQVM